MPEYGNERAILAANAGYFNIGNFQGDMHKDIRKENVSISIVVRHGISTDVDILEREILGFQDQLTPYKEHFNAVQKYH